MIVQTVIPSALLIYIYIYNMAWWLQKAFSFSDLSREGRSFFALLSFGLVR